MIDRETYSTWPLLTLALTLSFVAVIACGIPFVPPLWIVAVPLASSGLLCVAIALRRPDDWTKWRLIFAAFAVAWAFFALYLAIGQHHLIDWLEGHG